MLQKSLQMKNRPIKKVLNKMLNFKGNGAWRSLEARLLWEQVVYFSIANFPMISRGVSRKKSQKSGIFNQNVTKNVTKNDLTVAPQVPYSRMVLKFFPSCFLGRKKFDVKIMKSSLLFILILFFLSGCGHIQMFKDWDKTDTALMATSLGLTFVDYRQTVDLSKKYNDGYFEKYNACCLGSHPSRGQINTYFLTSALTKTIIAGLLPKNKNSCLGIFGRESWLILNIGISAGCVSRNFEIGLGVNF